MNGILKKTALAVTGFVFLATSATAAPTLPDFVPLAKKAGPAVVNISTEREVESPVMDMFNFPGMERFFEQFGGPFQAQEQRSRLRLHHFRRRLHRHQQPRG